MSLLPEDETVYGTDQSHRNLLHKEDTDLPRPHGSIISSPASMPSAPAPKPTNWLDAHCQFMIILPDSGLKRFWNIVFAVLLLYTLTLFPFKLCFLSFKILEDSGDKTPDDTEGWRILGLITDILFWIDLFINFLSAYSDKKGETEATPTKVIKNYLSGFFILDFVACLPPNAFGAIVRLGQGKAQEDAQGDEAGKALRLVRVGRLARLTRLMRLTRLTRLLKVGQIFRRFEFIRQMEKSRGARIAKLTLTLAFVVHLLACGWYLVAALHDDATVTWVGRRAETLEGFMYAAPTLQWLHSMYFVFTVFTTVGFGDIYAVSEAEILYAILTMLIGAVAHSIIVSEMINVVTHVDEADLDHDKKRELFSAFCRHAGISKNNEKVMRQQAAFSQDGLFRFDRRLMHQLISTNFFPREVTEDLSSDAFSGELRKNAFFRCLVKNPRDISTDPRPTLLVALYISARELLRGQPVYRRSDHPAGVFFIAAGTCAGVEYQGKDWPTDENHSTDEASPHKSSVHGNQDPLLAEGEAKMWPYQLFGVRSYFGDYEIIYDRSRMTTMRCESEHAEVYLLPKKGFTEVAQEFPRFQANLKREAKRRESHRHAMETKFMTKKRCLSYKHLAVRYIQKFARQWKKKVARNPQIQDGSHHTQNRSALGSTFGSALHRGRSDLRNEQIYNRSETDYLSERAVTEKEADAEGKRINFKHMQSFDKKGIDSDQLSKIIESQVGSRLEGLEKAQKGLASNQSVILDSLAIILKKIDCEPLLSTL